MKLTIYYYYFKAINSTREDGVQCHQSDFRHLGIKLSLLSWYSSSFLTTNTPHGTSLLTHFQGLNWHISNFLYLRFPYANFRVHLDDLEQVAKSFQWWDSPSRIHELNVGLAFKVLPCFWDILHSLHPNSTRNNWLGTSLNDEKKRKEKRTTHTYKN